ncbi:MAG TPA: amidase [Kofleriaceae bacterium]|nr:amidase [Kofleriaceae bacterium]
MRLVSCAAVVWLGCGGGGGHVEPPARPASDAELDLPLVEQVARMEAGTLRSADVTRGYLARIEQRDRGASGVHAYLSLAPDAPAQAAAVDGKRGHGALLQGAVIGVKDNIDTARLATTAGSLALAGNVPASDAPIVAKLRAANAVIVGKTNLSEWANFRSTKSTSGWSSAGGQTIHATKPGYNPCGSSSGSAVAVRAGTASATLGTETDGSIVCPASINGVVGFKPTVGLVSRTGIVPISATQDTAGPITKTVADAARVLHVIAGRDPADPATAAIPATLDLDFEAALGKASLQGVRLGVVKPASFDVKTLAVFDRACEQLTAAGAVLVAVKLPEVKTLDDDELAILLYEFKDGINAYLASHARAGQAKTLAELIAFDTANAAKVMPYFQQEIFEQAQATAGLSDPKYVDAKRRARTVTLDNGIAAVLAADKLDALIAPTQGPAWKIDYAKGDVFSGSSSQFAAVAGAPHLTVPMGDVDGFPVGLSVFGKPWDDGRVLAIGHAYEQLPYRLR